MLVVLTEATLGALIGWATLVVVCHYAENHHRPLATLTTVIYRRHDPT